MAELILSSPHDDTLTAAILRVTSPFVREELGMKKFSEEDLSSVNQTMQEYIDDVTAASKADPA
eukprot:1999311-Pyramimonas_sp.AAC.1